MKKYLFGILALMMATVVSISLASCSSDDDDSGNGSGSRDSELVGIWCRRYNNVSMYGFEFEKNGKGYYNEWGVDENETPRDGGSFEWSTSNGILTYLMDDDKEEGEDYSEKWRYELSEDKTTLKLYGISDNTVYYTLTKQ